MVEYCKKHRKGVWCAALSAAVIVVGVLLVRVAHAEVTHTIDGENNVKWGGQASAKQIEDGVLPGEQLTFFWTQADGMGHTGYNGMMFFNEGEAYEEFKFHIPADQTVTDYLQEITDIATGETSLVHVGNIQRRSPWALYSLAEITDDYRIPDFAPGGSSGGLTIYTAVNLQEYVENNPNGPLDGDWSRGDLLTELNLSIVNGQISGVSGIYFATAPFVLDPDSTTGWVPENGSAGWLDSSAFMTGHACTIRIIGQHDFADHTP